MKCITAKAFGEIDEVLSMSVDYPRPKLISGSGQMLIRVQACSLSPGDWRMLSGACELIKTPPSFPYIPGLDVAGIVEEVDDGTDFKVGDNVIASWSASYGIGGMAEYALVEVSNAVIRPESLSIIDASALANSASHAISVFQNAQVIEGDRVLVLGGSGGLATTLVQLIKDAGSSFLAATSTDEVLMQSLGVDHVVNYREQDWWEVPEFKNNPFDVIIDCAEGTSAWKRASSDHSLLKTGCNGGRFVAVVWNEWHIEMRSCCNLLTFFCPPALRHLWTRLCCPFVPRYKLQVGSVSGETLSNVLQLVEEGRFKVVLDPSSPFPFTADGVKRAFHLLASRGGHGKIVVNMEADQGNQE